VAFESCAYHIPVICTPMGGLPEIIEKDENGWFCDVNNPASLGETIMKAYNSPDLIRACSLKARKAVCEMLDAGKMLDKYCEIFPVSEPQTTAEIWK
jgi:glycosyltransferase involved in cell wall biosynthesis